MPADVKTIVVANQLLVRDDVDANLACVLTKTLFDKLPQLQQVVGAAKGIKLDTARDTDPVPLNRGAEQALNELGGAQVGANMLVSCENAVNPRLTADSLTG